MLFIRVKHKMGIFGVIPFIKLQNDIYRRKKKKKTNKQTNKEKEKKKKTQTYKRLKGMLFTMAKHSTRIFGVTPFIKLQIDT